MAGRTASIAAKMTWGLFALAAFAIGLTVANLPVRAPASAEAPTAPTAAPAAVAQPAKAEPAEGPFVVRSILPIQGPLKMGEWHWNEDAAPAEGPIVITVDIGAQTLSVFRAGHEIGAATILYGADDKPTPLGAFPITEKDADHVSNLYDVPMPYMLRLTNDGISIHGSDVKPAVATHGCIGVPHAFAKKLFAVAKLRDTVIVTRGKMLQMGDRIIAA